MAVDPQHIHKPGALKQQNKSHKHGKHRSKGQLDRDTKGRVNVKILTKKNKQLMKKMDRRNQALQKRKQKRDEVLEKKRSRGGCGTPPHFVVILALHKKVDPAAALNLLQQCDEEAVVVRNEQGITHISIPRFKQRASFFIPDYGNLIAVLDAVKIADSVLCVLSAEEGIDLAGEFCLSCLSGQGIPSATFVCQGFKNLSLKKQTEARKFIQRKLEKRFPTDKFHSLDTSQDALLVMRQITNQKLRTIYYREHRPNLIAENITFEMDGADNEFGTLKVTGYLRGRALSVNRLVHLPGWGDFQLKQIDAPSDPYPLDSKTEKHKKKTHVEEDVGMEEEGEGDVRILNNADPSRQESLQTEVIPDPLAGEQTWPTDEELAEAEREAKKKVTKMVPKGTSEYQAAWITDSGEESNDDGGDDSSDDDMDADMQEAGVEEESDEENQSDAEDNEEFDTMTITEGDDAAKYDAAMDLDEEDRMLNKLKEEKQNQMFPDEVDTPIDMLSKQRFARYRGLKSFRTSPWDPKENLPADYSRIFQFENFQKTKKRYLSEEPEDGAMAGWFITVHVANVPKAFLESYKPGTPVVLFGLLPHEQKMSVLHFVIKKVQDVTEPVKSKERLIFHVGYRRFSACPVFSQHTTGNKHKFERFLPTDVAAVATVYAPVMYPPVPAIVFKETSDGVHQLIAKGSLLSVNPDRIVVKRIVLSGYPCKILKRSAVIRYMFFNREDILWFKPVELRTKWGRRGHIKEPLGTHGHMKCVFDGSLKSQDTVLMNLYKRMYPKWTYNSYVPNSPVIKEYVDSTDHMEDEEEESEAYKIFSS